MRVLLVEDSERLRRSISDGLRKSGFAVDTSADGEEGLHLARTENYDAIVLDIMLPKIDGLQVLQRLRDGGKDTHVLLLTARDTMPDIVHGLNLGADDYLTKPFQIQVFVAQVRAISRRRPVIEPSFLKAGDLVLDTTNRIVIRDGQTISLTRKEYSLLELLMRRKNQLVTRNQVREVGWSYDVDVSDSSIDFYMHSLRSKIDLKGRESQIRTVRALGYMLVSS